MSQRQTGGDERGPSGRAPGDLARRSPAERRARLVDAAQRLIMTKGVSATSVGEIVRAAGVAQGTFYLYFRGKDEIVNAVAEAWGDRWYERAAEVVAREDLDGVEKLFTMLAARSELEATSDELVDFYRHVHRSENRAFHDALAGAQARRLAPLVEQTVREGVAQGLFRTHDPAGAAVWIVASVVGAEAILDPSDPGYDAARWAASFVGFVLGALGCTATEARVAEILERLVGRRG